MGVGGEVATGRSFRTVSGIPRIVVLKIQHMSMQSCIMKLASVFNPDTILPTSSLTTKYTLWYIQSVKSFPGNII